MDCWYGLTCRGWPHGTYLAKIERRTYHLPIEAEWEFAWPGGMSTILASEEITRLFADHNPD